MYDSYYYRNSLRKEWESLVAYINMCEDAKKIVSSKIEKESKKLYLLVNSLDETVGSTDVDEIIKCSDRIDSLKDILNKKILNEECVKQIKRRIRSLNKSYDKYLQSDKWGRTIGGSYDDYDRRGMKYVIPKVLTPEEVRDEIERTWQHWYNPYEDGRDCTGVWFTTSILVFPIKGAGKTVVYHEQHMDC